MHILAMHVPEYLKCYEIYTARIRKIKQPNDFARNINVTEPEKTGLIYI